MARVLQLPLTAPGCWGYEFHEDRFVVHETCRFLGVKEANLHPGGDGFDRAIVLVEQSDPHHNWGDPGFRSWHQGITIDHDELVITVLQVRRDTAYSSYATAFLGSFWSPGMVLVSVFARGETGSGWYPPGHPGRRVQVALPPPEEPPRPGDPRTVILGDSP